MTGDRVPAAQLQSSKCAQLKHFGQLKKAPNPARDVGESALSAAHLRIDALSLVNTARIIKIPAAVGRFQIGITV